MSVYTALWKELNQQIYSAVIFCQEEKCSEDNKKCECLSVDKKGVLICQIQKALWRALQIALHN